MMFWIHAACFVIAAYLSIYRYFEPGQLWDGHDDKDLIIALLYVALFTKPMQRVRSLEWRYWFPRRCDQCSKILDECNSHSQHPRICCTCCGH